MIVRLSPPAPLGASQHVILLGTIQEEQVIVAGLKA